MNLFSRRSELTVASLSVDRVLDKLSRAEIPVFCVRKGAKNELTFEVETSKLEKTFAILRGSCYNIKKSRSRGLTLLYKKCISAAGLLLGVLLFALCVLFAETRTLKIEVIGSGAYYGQEVLEILAENGVKRFSPLPRERAKMTAEILALPLVSGCLIKSSGGILTVEVQTSGEAAVLTAKPLLAPVSGKVEELVVLRGTPCVQAGDAVERGQTVADCIASYGEETRKVVVIARVKLSFPVEKEYAGSEEQARAGALLEYGEIKDIKAEKTEKGYLITGTAFAEASLNLE